MPSSTTTSTVGARPLLAAGLTQRVAGFVPAEPTLSSLWEQLDQQTKSVRKSLERIYRIKYNGPRARSSAATRRRLNARHAQDARARAHR
jgi:hypothetical protein